MTELIIILLLLILVGCVCFFIGKHLEGLRWSERAFLNGRRLLFQGKYYKVIQLPDKPDNFENTGEG